MMQIEDNTPYELFIEFLNDAGEVIERRQVDGTTREDNRGWEVTVNPLPEGEYISVRFQIVRKEA